MKLLIWIVLVIAPAASASAGDPAVPSRIEVIKSSQVSITNLESVESDLDSHGVDIDVYDIDAVKRFENSLSEHLPVDKARAEMVVRARVSSVGRDKIKRQVLRAYRGIILSMQYGLDRYPAIVFDKRSVVYGVTDMAEALADYRRWKAKQGGAQ